MTNFQDLNAKVKNLVALVPVLGEISHPAPCALPLKSVKEQIMRGGRCFLLNYHYDNKLNL